MILMGCHPSTPNDPCSIYIGFSSIPENPNSANTQYVKNRGVKFEYYRGRAKKVKNHASRARRMTPFFK